MSDFNHGNYQAAKKALMTGTQSTIFIVRQCYVLIALSRDRCMTVITGVTFKRDHCTTEKTATNFFELGEENGSHTISHLDYKSVPCLFLL